MHLSIVFLIRSYIHPFIHPPFHSFIHSPIHRSIHSLIRLVLPGDERAGEGYRGARWQQDEQQVQQTKQPEVNYLYLANTARVHGTIILDGNSEMGPHEI